MYTEEIHTGDIRIRPLQINNATTGMYLSDKFITENLSINMSYYIPQSHSAYYKATPWNLSTYLYATPVSSYTSVGYLI
jgi:hypothetical protein